MSKRSAAKFLEQHEIISAKLSRLEVTKSTPLVRAERLRREFPRLEPVDARNAISVSS